MATRRGGKAQDTAEEESVLGLSEILNEIKEFRTETAGNFGALKKEVSELKEGFGELKIRMDAEEQRIVENEDREINMAKLLVHSLRQQKQLEAKCDSLESRDRRNNLRIYSVPENCAGNNVIEFVEKLIKDKLGVD